MTGVLVLLVALGAVALYAFSYLLGYRHGARKGLEAACEAADAVLSAIAPKAQRDGGEKS